MQISNPQNFVAEFPRVIDATILRDFRSCPMRAYRSHCLSIVPKDIESPDLVAGAAFAKGLEAARNAIYGTDTLSVEDALAIGLEALTIEYGLTDFYDYKGNPHIKSWENTAAMLQFYFDAYPPAADPIQPYYLKTGLPAVEFSFGIPLPIHHPDTGDPLLYGGRLDMFGVFHDQLWVVDEKTTKALGARWSESWDLRSQFIGYCWAAKYYGYPVAGAIVRGMKFAVKEFDTAQAIIYAKDYLTDRWYKQTLRDINRMIRCWTSGYFDYNLDDACTSYSGCPYRILCQVEDETIWYSDYVKRKWNPLASNPALEPSIDAGAVA